MTRHTCELNSVFLSRSVTQVSIVIYVLEHPSEIVLMLICCIIWHVNMFIPRFSSACMSQTSPHFFLSCHPSCSIWVSPLFSPWTRSSIFHRHSCDILKFISTTKQTMRMRVVWDFAYRVITVVMNREAKSFSSSTNDRSFRRDRPENVTWTAAKLRDDTRTTTKQ